MNATAELHKRDRAQVWKPRPRGDASDATTDVPHRNRIPQMTDHERDVLLANVDKNVALLTQLIESTCKKVEQHDLDINGDGKPGIKAELIATNGRLERANDKLNAYGKAVWTGVSALIIVLVNSFLDLLVY